MSTLQTDQLQTLDGQTTIVVADIVTTDAMPQLDASTLPTSDPHENGKLWNNNGVLSISAG